MYMAKRSLSLYYSMNVTLIFAIISLIVMNGSFVHYKIILPIIFSNIALFFVALFLYLILVKTWLLYYKYQWTYYTIELEWSFIINSKSASTESEENWFIKNNAKYGNLWYIYKLFGIFFIIFHIIIASMMSMILYFEWDLIMLIIGGSVSCIMYSIVGIFYLWLARHTPFIDDPYKIHWESRMHSKLLLLWCIFMGIFFTMSLFIPSFHVYVWGVTAMNFAYFLMIYVSTIKLSRLQHVNIASPNNDDNSNPTNESSEDVVTPSSLDMVLSDSTLIHHFMVHLSKEYSMELLLSYIEMTQFQKYIAKYMKDHDCDVKDIDIALPNFPDNIPMSEIIEAEEEIVIVGDTDSDDRFIDNAKIKAHKIYNKYIRQGSEFEVNISSAERGRLANLLHKLEVLMSYNMNLRDLMLLFEKCKMEMKLLQSFSCTRFRSDSEFIHSL